MKTKLLKVLEALKKGGYYGVHSFPLMKESGTTRVAARICDLKKLGYIIISKRERFNGVDGCKYFLKGKKEGTTVADKPVVRYKFEGTQAIAIS